ncbi:MAG: response regulator [Lachnospiraceae bacterium]|nr:response regulator [Lachnospiraceae bacterium]
MKKWKKSLIITLIAIVLNVGGRLLAGLLDAPGYVNLLGTVIAAYFGGPLQAVVSAVISSGISTIFHRGDILILAADIAFAVPAGLIVRKNKYFTRFFNAVSATAFFAVTRAVFMFASNMIFYGGRTELAYPDAVIDFLTSVGFARVICYVIAAIYISFFDSFVVMLIVFVFVSVYRYVRRRRLARELKNELKRGLAIGLFLAVLCGTAGFSADSYAESKMNFVDRLYNAGSGLTGGCLNDLCMTADGTMWIGTYGGLYRFNGTKFVLIDEIKSVRAIQKLYVDSEDRLWVGSQDAGVTVLNIDKSFYNIDMESGLPSNAVKSIIQDSNGLYYIATTGGLVTAEYTDGEIRIDKLFKDIGNVKALTADKAGHVAALNSVGDVYLFDSGEQVGGLSYNSLKATGVNFDPEGNLYIGTDTEVLFKYQIDDNKFNRLSSIRTDGITDIRDLLFEDNGIIYIASDSGTGYLDSMNRVNRIYIEGFDQSIEHVYKDYQGNIWFASSKYGLLCMNRSNFTDLFKMCSTKSTACNAVLEWDRYMYVATDDGLRVLKLDSSRTVNNKVTRALEGIRVRAMCIDKTNGDLLLATYGKGLVKADTDGNVEEYSGESENDRKIRIVCQLTDGTIVTSGDIGLFFYRSGKLSDKLLLGEELGGGTVLNILETGDGTLFGGTDGDGIAVIKDGEVLRYITKNDGLSSGVILRIVKDVNSSGYFVLTGSGVDYMTADYEIREIRLPYYNNFDIVQNDRNEVFVIGGAGIFVINYEQFMDEGNSEGYVLLDTKAGLPGSLTSNAWKYVSGDGILYVCGNTGVYSLDLYNYEMKSDKYLTKITSVKLDGLQQDVTEIGEIYIPRGVDKIDLDIELNNYTTSDPYIRYYMAGVDREKTTRLSSTMENVTYYSIPYGDHKFYIDVLDETGKVLSEQVYVFRKDQELYETTGFRIYFYLMLTGFVAFIVSSIVQGALYTQNRKANDIHERIVSQLEREKAEALGRAMHMEEDQKRKEARFLENMSREIRNPVNAIIGMDTLIQRESDQSVIREYAKEIDSAGRRLLKVAEKALIPMDNNAEADGEGTGTVGDGTSGRTGSDEDARFYAPEARVLLVDDDEMNLSVLRRFLERIKTETDTAASAKEAVDRAKKRYYDIMIIGSDMRETGCEEIMRLIRKECPFNSEIPVLVLAPFDKPGAREEFMRLGFTNYLSNPISALKLEAMLENYLPDEKIVPVCGSAEGEETKNTDLKRAGIKKTVAEAAASGVIPGFEEEHPSELALKIGEIDGIDAERGIGICGGEDLYGVLCRNFCKNAPERTKLVEDSVENGDMECFTVQMRDLKGTARLIGAFELSERAGELEQAGYEENFEMIKTAAAPVVSEARRLYEELGKVLDNNI